MRLRRLVLRGFRNLADATLDFPDTGVALLGDNGQGKTNLMEAVYYPVFFRSVHAAGDREVTRFEGAGFALDATLALTQRERRLSARYTAQGRVKQLELDGAPVNRLSEAVGHWLAVAFLPRDLTLAAGGALERRRYLDRMLAVADPGYFRALTRYRAALSQRNAALRQNRPDLAQAFDAPLSEAGAAIIRARLGWIAWADQALARELERLGEPCPVSLRYQGRPELAESDAWSAALAQSAVTDRNRGVTTIGPHRDDLRLLLGGRPVREFGSTGQQRSMAIGLKFLELATIEAARGVAPALLLDDVFAELDRDRQQRLATRLRDASERQVFLSSPRADELPPGLALPVWTITQGRVAGGC